MSKNFEISEVFKENQKILKFYSLVKVKSKDKKFENFPPCSIFKCVAENVEKLRNFKVYHDDVFLCGYPRSGTTMMQEMIWLILNDFDFTKAKEKYLFERFPVIGSSEIYCNYLNFYKNKTTIDYAALSRPRTIKTHLPVQFLPKDFWEIQPKIIYISRDPRDVAISYYHLMKNVYHSDVTFKEILQLFLDEQLGYAPYRKHCLDFWNIPDYANILYLTYEEIIKNIDKAILQVGKFLGKEISEDNLKLLKEHLKFENMRENDSCNSKHFMERMNEITQKNRKPEGFIRKGKTENFKEEMPEEFKAKFEIWMREFEKMKSSFESTY